MVVRKAVLVYISLFTLAVESSQHDLIVNTTLGPIQGQELKVMNETIYQWLGVPYAEKPLGDLRFREPQLPQKWFTPVLTQKEPPACPQRKNSIYASLRKTFYMWVPTVNMSEDCLYLNVYTPKSPAMNANLSVIVWIHGGAFDRGAVSMNTYNPKMIVAKEGVIVVTVQYRLGVLSLLYFNTTNTSSNLGLMDQRMALQWVKSNIVGFGGNENDITLMGESAGAASVGYQMISNQSKHLFEKVIVQSGSPFTFWAYTEPKEMFNRTMMFAKTAGCKGRNIDKIVGCLRNMSVEHLLKSIKSILSFTPTIDGNFLTKDPFQAVKDRDFSRKPILSGLVQNEGMPGVISFMLQIKKFNFNNFTEADFNFTKGLLGLFFKKSRQQVSRLFAFYLKEYGKKDYLNVVSQIFGDAFASCPTLEFVRNISEFNNTMYFYYFNHRSSNCLDPFYTQVMHGAEVPYQFGLPFWIVKNYTDDDRVMSAIVMKNWATFARTGKPANISWPPFHGRNGTYFELKTTSNLTVVRRENFCDAWNENGGYYKTIRSSDLSTVEMQICIKKMGQIPCLLLMIGKTAKDIVAPLVTALLNSLMKSLG